MTQVEHLTDKLTVELQNRSFARHTTAQDDMGGKMGSKLLEALLEERPEEVPEKPTHNPVLYVKTRTIKAGSLTEVECYPVYQGMYQRELQKTRRTPDAMRAVNDRNARKRFERLAECNFRAGKDYALTLTYAGGAPENMDDCCREFRNYMNRVNRARKKLGLSKARCMAVIEAGKNGRLHHHILIEGGLDRDQMEQLWRNGFANCDRIQSGPQGLTALAKYMTKGFGTKRETGRHRYFYTRNLRQPIVTESKTRISRRQAELIREDADLQGEVIMRKKYPGMTLESLIVRQTDWLPGAYIYARLRNNSLTQVDRDRQQSVVKQNRSFARHAAAQDDMS